MRRGATDIARVLEEDIVAGRLRPRERLVETELAQRFQTSRAPVREALRLLESDRLVIKPPAKGVRVADLSLEEAEEIFVILGTLQGLAARLAARRMSPADLRRLEQTLRKMERLGTATDLHGYFDLNLVFHDLIGRAARNQKLQRLTDSLGKQASRYRFAAMAGDGRVAKSIREHRAILEAIRAGKGRLAFKIAEESAAGAFKALRRARTRPDSPVLLG
ncbi:MAG: GntR family transcriptional regulator [Candidatus Rokubacteria bacterium]|nr:GntR family transcriptional regulator [Candidatus Rokubacteria bacterium]